MAVSVTGPSAVNDLGDLVIPGSPESLIGQAKENALNNPPCPITPTLTSSSVHRSSHQLNTTFLSYYNVT